MWAKCRKCGSVFEPKGAIGIGSTTSVTLNINGVKTNCPRLGCGGTAEFISGEYRFESGVLREIRNLSPENAQLLLSLLQRIARTPADNEPVRRELMEQVAQVSPPTAELLTKSGIGLSVLSIIIAILTYLSQVQSAGDSTAYEAKMLELTAQLVAAQQAEASAAAKTSPALQPTETPQASRSESDKAEQSEEPISKRRQRRLRGKEKVHRWDPD